jgi:hypothetical protein
LVSFLGLYAIEKMPEKLKKYEVDFHIDNKEFPQKSDLEQKNKANFTYFFKQRMGDLVRVCKQKVRNIKGKQSEEFLVFYGKNEPPKYLNGLIEEYKSHGYKKLDLAVFKSIRKKINVEVDCTMFKSEDVWYIAIPLEQSNLDLEDIIGSDCNPYENRHNMGPDEILNSHQTVQNLDDFNDWFYNKSDYRKRVTLKKFIAKNKNKVQYKEEIAIAKRLLKSETIEWKKDLP